MLKRARALSWILLLALAACGGSSGGGTPPQTELEILTQQLGQGNVGHSFYQLLAAAGGQEPYSWWVSSSGDPLPAGISLTNDGQLAGTPTESRAATVVVAVRGADSSLDLRSFLLEVRDIEIEGGTGSALTPGQQLALSASGGSPSYQFALQTNMSGASISTDGSYTAGNNSGVDVIRATDNDGFYDELAVTIGSDPFIGFQAIWGSTDVWWVNWDVVYDPSPLYATDIDEVLVSLGLRRSESTDAAGTEADQLARLLLIRRALGHLSQYYGNNDNGSPKQGGLSISFVGPAGTSGTTPAVGSVLGAAPSRYSTICTRYGPNQGVVGTAWLDGNNVNVEHNCGNPSNTPLGVFANRILGPYLQAYNNSISQNPVGPSDVDGLRSLLDGNPPANARESDIFDVADNYGRTLAAVLAHEIGHSLGLQHSSPSEGLGDIMNASLNVGQSIQYAFNGGHWASLQSGLPGPNR